MSAVGANTAVKWGRSAGIWGLKQAFWRRTTRPLLRRAKHVAQERIIGPLERLDRKKDGLGGFIAKRIDNIPGARGGLQAISEDRRADVAKRQEELSKRRTGELVRLLEGGVMPNTRAAIIQEIAKRDDLDELSVEEARRGREQLVKAGMSTLSIDKLRPDIQPDLPSIMGAMIKQRKPADVSALHPVIVSGDNREEVAEAMVRTYDGGMMAAAVRRGDAISKAYIDTLFKLAGTDDQERSSEKIAAMFNKLGEENARKAKEAQTRNDKQAYELYQKLSVRNYTAAADVMGAPARRLMNLDPDRSRRSPQNINTSGMTPGEQRLAREAQEFSRQRQRGGDGQRQDEHADEEDTDQ